MAAAVARWTVLVATLPSRTRMLSADDQIAVLGVPVDCLPAGGVRAAIEEMIRDPWDGHCRHVVTLNPEYVMAARGDAAFANALGSADLITVDGVGVLLAARLYQGRSALNLDRVTGVDILGWLTEASGAASAALFLLGAGPGVAEAAASALSRSHQNARIAGWWDAGTPLPQDDAVTMERIEASGARLVAVAYGAPGQVLWIARNQEALAAAGVRVAIGVGGSLDFVAGRVARAPRFVQRIGLEWLYRLVREPWRWRRQTVLPIFATLVLRDWIRQRLTRSSR